MIESFDYSSIIAGIAFLLQCLDCIWTDVRSNILVLSGTFSVYGCTIFLLQFWVHFVVLHFVGEPIFSQCRYLAEPFFSLQICQVLGVYFVKDWWEWQVDVNAFWVMRSRTLLSKLRSVSECKSISIPIGPCGIDRLWVDTHSSYYSFPLNSSHDSVPCKCSCIFSVLVTPLIEWSIYL